MALRLSEDTDDSSVSGRTGGGAGGFTIVARQGPVARPLVLCSGVGALVESGTSGPPDQTVGTAVCVFALYVSVAGSRRPKTAKARIMSPMPVSSSATPTTSPNTASRSAM